MTAKVLVVLLTIHDVYYGFDITFHIPWLLANNLITLNNAVLYDFSSQWLVLSLSLIRSNIIVTEKRFCDACRGHHKDS